MALLGSLAAAWATASARDETLRGYVDATEDADLPFRMPHLGVNAELTQYDRDELDTQLGEMEAAGIAKPDLDEQQAADLFAYFYSLRYFEEPGDGGRGKQIFARKRCSSCHSSGGGAPPVEIWPVVEDPLELARAMWNHAPKMRDEMRRRLGGDDQSAGDQRRNEQPLASCLSVH